MGSEMTFFEWFGRLAASGGFAILGFYAGFVFGSTVMAKPGGGVADLVAGFWWGLIGVILAVIAALVMIWNVDLLPFI